ncbi:MAG: hypothetical protein ACI9MR_004701 [Myxococcota bacterium]|jgi:hypothetical protein
MLRSAIASAIVTASLLTGACGSTPSFTDVTAIDVELVPSSKAAAVSKNVAGAELPAWRSCLNTMEEISISERYKSVLMEGEYKILLTAPKGPQLFTLTNSSDLHSAAGNYRCGCLYDLAAGLHGVK